MSILPGLGGTAGFVPVTLRYVGGYAVGFAGTTIDTTVTLGSLTGGLAATPAVDDLVILAFAVANDDTAVDLNLTVTTAGYTELADLFSDDAVQDTNLAVFWKRMGNPPDTSVDVGQTFDIGNAGAVAVHVWRGAHSVTPIDVTTTTATGVNTVLADPPSITPANPGAVIIVVGAGSHYGGVATFTHSGLSNVVSAGSNDNEDITVAIGYYASWASGAYNPAAFTFSSGDSADYSWCAATIAIRRA